MKKIRNIKILIPAIGVLLTLLFILCLSLPAMADDEVVVVGGTEVQGDEENSVLLGSSVNTYDEENANTLTTNLTAMFLKNSAYASITDDTFFAALGVRTMGEGENLDVDAIKANLEEARSSEDGILEGVLAKYILALTAAGIDCSVYGNGELSLTGELEAKLSEEEIDVDIYSAVVILPVFQIYGDENDFSADLIKLILATQDENGLFTGLWGNDTQITAQAVLALTAWRGDNEAVSTAVNKALTAIATMQNEDGGFAYGSYSSKSDVETTGNVVAALIACGKAVTTDYQTMDGSDPIGYLIAAAGMTLDGYPDEYAPDMAMADALAGLSAFANGIGTNIYDIDLPDNDGADGSVVPVVDGSEPATPIENNSESASQSEANSESPTSTSTETTTVAATTASTGTSASTATQAATTNRTSTATTSDTVKTGDRSNASLYIIMALVAAGIGGFVIRKLVHRR